ncbi:SHOCT domain-containing protein [Actinocorallia sp. A-T 12471]|uniref:SHOCT domain-containing protein n=1 Tax=Actinocorallia sp. A-T 12471 TaxID=3089813 RepID=UPI0029D1F432|nr:SHOCT domain-containing protein [Actinocorallia sp. A-T 12471]MDX6744617.1 SHOCT domain-containing protein [Actinocorallia sp. A-T 12471]
MIRAGRPGLLGTMARTAVITGTASAVSGRVQRRQARRDVQQEAQYAQPQPQPQPQPPPTQPPQPAQAQPAQGDDRIARLQKLADLRDSGVLTPEEFAAEKARVLGS